MSKRAADVLAETLEIAGVKRVYGVVGDSLNGFTDALRARGAIEWIHVRHEEGAAFAAGAEAHLTGRLAVCAGSCGPGNGRQSLLGFQFTDGARAAEPFRQHVDDCGIYVIDAIAQLLKD